MDVNFQQLFTFDTDSSGDTNVQALHFSYCQQLQDKLR